MELVGFKIGPGLGVGDERVRPKAVSTAGRHHNTRYQHAHREDQQSVNTLCSLSTLIYSILRRFISLPRHCDVKASRGYVLDHSTAKTQH